MRLSQPPPSPVTCHPNTGNLRMILTKGGSGIRPCGGVSGWNFHYRKRSDTTISTSPESGLESNASLLSSLDDLLTLREMLGLPDRESSPEEMDDDDDNNVLEHLFWIPPDVESPSNSLRPSSPALKPLLV